MRIVSRSTLPPILFAGILLYCALTVPLIAQDSLDVANLGLLYDTWTAAGKMVVVDDIGFMPSMTHVRMLDVSHPDTIIDLNGNRDQLTFYCNYIRPVGKYLWCFNERVDTKVRVVDIEDPADPQLVAVHDLSTEGQPLFSVIRDGEGHLICTQWEDDEIDLWDLSNPDEPTPLGSITHSQIGAVTTLQNGVYVAETGTREIHRYQQQGNSLSYEGVWRIWQPDTYLNLLVRQNRLFVQLGDTLNVYGLGDDSVPLLYASTLLGGEPNERMLDIHILQDLLLVLRRRPNMFNSSLHVIDFSDTLNPVYLYNNTAIEGAHVAGVVGNETLCAHPGGYGPWRLVLYDHDDLLEPNPAPVYLDSHQPSPSEVAVQWPFLYVKVLSNIEIYSIEDVTNPQLLTVYHHLDGVNDMKLQEDYLIIKGQSTNALVDVSDPAHPEELFAVQGCGQDRIPVHVQDGDLYVVKPFQYLVRYDISELRTNGNVVAVDSLYNEQFSHKSVFHVFRDSVLFMSYNRGLADWFTVDVSTPGQMELLRHEQYPNQATYMKAGFVHGDSVTMVDLGYKWFTYSFADPWNPELVSYVDVPAPQHEYYESWPWDLAKLGPYWLVSSHNNKPLYLLRVDSSESPPISQVETFGYGWRFEADDHCLVYADRLAVHLLEFSTSKTPEDGIHANISLVPLLHELYPNPFNPAVTVPLSLPQAMDIKLAVYNVQGQQVALLAAGQFGAGRHTLVWDGATEYGKAASGVYFVRLETEREVQTRRVFLVK